MWHSINISSLSIFKDNILVNCFTRNQQRWRKGAGRQTVTLRDNCSTWQMSILHFISQEWATCIGTLSQQASNQNRSSYGVLWKYAFYRTSVFSSFRTYKQNPCFRGAKQDSIELSGLFLYWSHEDLALLYRGDNLL